MSAKQNPTPSVEHFAHDAVTFDEAELDLTLLEMSIETDLDVTVQRALLGRVMLSLSLAASVQDQQVYDKSIERLGPVASPFSEVADDWREQYRFYLELLRQVGSDLLQELEGEAMPDYDQFVTRMQLLFEVARQEAGLAMPALVV